MALFLSKIHQIFHYYHSKTFSQICRNMPTLSWLGKSLIRIVVVQDAYIYVQDILDNNTNGNASNPL
jgi:hypothetical protein